MHESREQELLRLAQETKGFMPDDEGLALTQLARSCGRERSNATMLEIGSWCGKSAVYLGIGVEETGATLFSLDHHHGSEENQEGWEHFDPELLDPRDGRLNTLSHFQTTIALADLEQSVVGIVGESTVVAQHWQTPLALLFIDGGHGSQVAHADYDAWVHKVALGGSLAIHDVFEDPADGGQTPYELYVRALQSEAFEPISRVGSLAVLRRIR